MYSRYFCSVHGFGVPEYAVKHLKSNHGAGSFMVDTRLSNAYYVRVQNGAVKFTNYNGVLQVLVQGVNK